MTNDAKVVHLVGVPVGDEEPEAYDVGEGRAGAGEAAGRNGMVERIVVSTRPVAVEYHIAALGKTLQDLIDSLLRWATATLPDVERARERFDEMS